MKANWNGKILAESEQTIEVGGYHYFPRAAVRMEMLRRASKTPRDLECPHGVQFYDVVIGGTHYPRNAWVYEAPQPKLAQVAGRFGFWEDVEIR